MNKRLLAGICLAVGVLTAVCAQENQCCRTTKAAQQGWEFKIKIGDNIGFISPMVSGDEVKSVDSYNPTFAPTIEASVTKWFGKRQRWGIVSGLKYENKNITTWLTMNEFDIHLDGILKDYLSVSWEGELKARMRNRYLTVPLLGAYRIGSRWQVKAGMYVSFLLDGDFSGNLDGDLGGEATILGKELSVTMDTRFDYDLSD